MVVRNGRTYGPTAIYAMGDAANMPPPDISLRSDVRRLEFVVRRAHTDEEDSQARLREGVLQACRGLASLPRVDYLSVELDVELSCEAKACYVPETDCRVLDQFGMLRNVGQVEIMGVPDAYARQLVKGMTDPQGPL